MIVSCFRSILCSSLLSKPILCPRYYRPPPGKPTLKELQNALVNINGLSPRPKKPLSALFQFYMDNKDKLRKEHPDVRRIHEVLKLATAIWYGLPAEVRKPYEDQYAEEFKEYLKATILYSESISPEQAEEIKELRQKLKEKRQEIKLKKKLKQLDRPKHPMNKFLLFCKEQMEKEPPPKGQIAPLRGENIYGTLGLAMVYSKSCISNTHPNIHNVQYNCIRSYGTENTTGSVQKEKSLPNFQYEKKKKPVRKYLSKNIPNIPEDVSNAKVNKVDFNMLVALVLGSFILPIVGFIAHCYIKAIKGEDY